MYNIYNYTKKFNNFFQINFKIIYHHKLMSRKIANNIIKSLKFNSIVCLTLIN